MTYLGPLKVIFGVKNMAVKFPARILSSRNGLSDRREKVNFPVFHLLLQE